MTLQQKISEISQEIINLIDSHKGSNHPNNCKVCSERVEKFLLEIAHFTAEGLRVERVKHYPDCNQWECKCGTNFFNSALEQIKIKSEELFK